MRRKDIKVGEEYAIGRDTSRGLLARGTVLEVGLHREVWRYGWHRGTSEVADGVRVRITERYGRKLEDPIEDIVQTRSIVRPWAEHEEVHRKRQEAKAARQAERAALREKKEQLISRVEERLGYVPSALGYSPGHITLALDEVEELLDWSDQ